ncbi:MAG: MATE family efflux transporter [Clostridia bacterium]|nr:MATE family efflux transporter [Clostridia bacterium]
MDNPFLTESPAKLYAKFLPSAVIGLLITCIASLVDSVVVSNFLGPVALSAVNICMPIFSVITALAMLLIGGACTMYSSYMGQNKQEQAQKTFTLATVVLIIVGVAYSVVGILFPGEVVRFLGANDAVFDFARDYASVLFWFTLANILFLLLLSFLRIDLRPSLTVVGVVSCALVNAVLDVVFVGPMGLGMQGAAAATGIAYVVGVLVMATHFFSKKCGLRFVKGFFSGKELGAMAVTGAPGAVAMFGTAIATVTFNNYIITTGEYLLPGWGVGELYVSVYSVVTQVLTVSMAVYMGIAQCAQPMIAANFGAGRKDRIKVLYQTGLKLEVIANLVLMVVLFFAARFIAGAFSMNKGVVDMTDTAVFAIRIFSLSLVFTGVNQMVQYLLQSVNAVRQSTVISLLAGTILLIAGLLFLSEVVFPLHEKALGIWLSYAFANALTMVYCFFVMRKKKQELFG